jgi:hypothetical protein
MGATSRMTITAPSNASDLVSGRSALVEIKTPGFVLPTRRR